MKSKHVRNEGESIDRGETLFPLPFQRKINRTMLRWKTFWHGWLLILLALFSGCVHVPMSSETAIDGPLQTMQPVEQGEVVVVYGENASVPNQSVAGSYFTANCAATTQGNTIGELIRSILKFNPQPGRFAVRHLMDLETEKDPDCMATGDDSILCRLNLSKAKVLADRLRYAIHVRETFHVPLYASPFGIASCGNKTVLETTVWELPTEKRIGSFAVSAEGEYTVLAYLFHIVVTRDTQKDAMERLAREITERLTGLKPL
jgi:hypothetical protein